MDIIVEIFFPPGSCHCTTKTFKEQASNIGEEIRKKYGVKVEIIYLPINAKRARELDIYEANAVVINEKPVLKGYYSANDLKRKIVEAIK